jgi:anti-sigma factor RsiW
MAGAERKHCSTEEWVDFVNGALSPERKREMQKHLDSRCRECSKMVELWQLVRHAAKRESEHEVPESAVRHVRNAFAMTHSFKGARPFQIPRLVFDSLWRPAAAGVRSTTTTLRQVIYKAGDVAIEMQLEPVAHTEYTNITGQVSNTAQQGEGMPNVLAAITSPEGAVATASTNQFGEFQLDFVPKSNLRISFAVVGGKELSIPLDGL